MSRRTIAICGDGASAALLLCALARLADADIAVVIIGTGTQCGAGVAYSTSNPHHLLNVTAERMSADPNDPGQFQNWLNVRGMATDDFARQFVARALYAKYLNDVIEKTLLATQHCSVRFVHAEVRSLIREGTRWKVWHGDGSVYADLVVLATGNDMPAPIAPRYSGSVANRIIDMPWNELAIKPEEDVLILGTGLTAIDTVVSLLDAEHTGTISLLSRHGLRPARHVPPIKKCPLLEPYPTTAKGLLRALRRAVGRQPRAEDWQGFMDSMRPVWSRIWQSLPAPEKHRFLRHGVAFWAVHRHRLAPQVADRIDAAMERNVRVMKGRLKALAAVEGGRLGAVIAHDGSSRDLMIDRVINCTGPNSDPYKSQSLLIDNIFASRLARRGPARLSFDVDATDRVIDRDGQTHATLFAIGALTRDRLWEITAIPEISKQAVAIANHIVGQLSILPK